MKVFGKICAVALAIVLIGVSIYFNATPRGKAQWNSYWHDVEKAGENTAYDNRKEVEDTCRAMIASYNADKLTYEQYKGSDSEEKQSWAEQAKMRANKTASSYNNYVLKNSYIWKGNVPSDICMNLAYIE